MTAHKKEDAFEMAYLRDNSASLLARHDFIGFGKVLIAISDEELMGEKGAAVAEGIAKLTHALVSGQSHKASMILGTNPSQATRLSVYESIFKSLSADGHQDPKHRRIFQKGLIQGLRSGAAAYVEEEFPRSKAGGYNGGDGVDSVLPAILRIHAECDAFPVGDLETAVTEGVVDGFATGIRDTYALGAISAALVRTRNIPLVRACAKAATTNHELAACTLQELDNGPALNADQALAYARFKRDVTKGLREKGVALLDVRGVFGQAATGNYAAVNLETPTESVVFIDGFDRSVRRAVKAFPAECAGMASVFARLAVDVGNVRDHDARMACEQAVVALHKAPNQPSRLERAVSAVKPLASALGRAIGRSPA